MKKITTILLCLAVLLGIFTVSAFAVYDVDAGEDIYDSSFDSDYDDLEDELYNDFHTTSIVFFILFFSTVGLVLPGVTLGLGIKNIKAQAGACRIASMICIIASAVWILSVAGIVLIILI